METWPQFIERYAHTLGITLAFAFGGAGLLLWSSREKYTTSRALLVIAAGQCLGAGATAFVHGYLSWSIFVAPVVGVVCGLVALPILLGIAKVGDRIGQRFPDIGDKLVDKYTRGDEGKVK